jgi:hypothetical protein
MCAGRTAPGGGGAVLHATCGGGEQAQGGGFRRRVEGARILFVDVPSAVVDSDCGTVSRTEISYAWSAGERCRLAALGLPCGQP